MRSLLTFLFFAVSLFTTAQSNQLWGMTENGGLNDLGTIFRVNRDGTGYEVVFSFDSLSGSGPKGGLCLAPNGRLYGLTNSDGANEVGTLFSISVTALDFEKIMDLSFGMAAYPWGSIILGSDGMLYGTGIGDMFRLNPATNEVTTIAQYGVNEGLIQGSNGLLYGADAFGGINGDGLIFSVDPVSSQGLDLHSFTEIDGKRPYGRLCQADNGKLYGMTYDGGANSNGVLYEFDPGNGQFEKLLDFDGANGNSPWSCLIRIGPDELLGSTTLGGAFGQGALFSLVPSTGTYTLKHSFSSFVDGSLLFGGIIQASDGMVYGMTTSGGSSGAGSIYQYDPSSELLATLHSFQGGAQGSSPNAELTEVGGQIGIAEHTHDGHRLSVSPNPAQEGTVVRLNWVPQGNALLRLTDQLGRTVWSTRSIGSTQRINLPAVQGVYQLTYADDAGRISTSLVVQ
jgi:uncharacterized repeat protein (TIGR03803 family)